MLTCSQPVQCYILQLEDINWRLNLQMAQARHTKQKVPNAMFELGVRTDSDTGSEKEKIRLEFTHDELYQFYNQVSYRP